MDMNTYTCGFGYHGAASRLGWDREVAELGIGAPMKEALTETASAMLTSPSPH